MTRTLVVGLGSHHGDDQVGWRIVARLAERYRPACALWPTSSPATILTRLGKGLYQRLIVCDACQGAGRPGELFRWRWPSAALPTRTNCTTHDLSLAATLALAERLRRLPDEVWIWGVEVGAVAAADEELSPEVAAAVPLAAEAILRGLERSPADA